ncbi:3665_t:CDS:2, partial [Cetraspora pellucida]
CPDGSICQNSNCTCPSGGKLCNGQCVGIQTDIHRPVQHVEMEVAPVFHLTYHHHAIVVTYLVFYIAVVLDVLALQAHAFEITYLDIN